MSADAPRDATPVRATRSLAFRSSAALGVAFGLAAFCLLVLFRPYLRAEFESESGELLRDQALRAASAARADADASVLLVRSSVQHALSASAATIDDLPLEFATPAAERVRAHAAERADELARATERDLDVLGDELRQRTEARLTTEQERVAQRNRDRAESFGRSTSVRAGALLLALFGGLLLLHGAFVYRTVLAPVRRLAEATRAVAQGRLGTRLHIAGDDEVARLGASFDTMTESLESAHGELEALNAELGERVRERTAELRAALEESRDANRRLEAALSELREKERELRHAEKMASLGTLAGGVAHEFNNLLGGILGCAEDAARESDPTELRTTLAMIERTARRGTAITGNLLRFARPGTGSAEEIDAADLARDVATLVDHEAVRLGVRVRVTASGETRLRGDASGLHQVLLNLATNALHAMRERGGELSLAVTGTPESVELCVSDTGVGIPADIRERLFEPFFTTRGPEGTGLGLSVSYGIVRAHGGRIEIESEPGHGATFRIALPRRQEAAAAAAGGGAA